jgi:tetratricopeptide (TPR) repeat protein
MDSNTKIQAKLLLAEIFVKTGNFDGAEAQYSSLLGEFGENAEAHYQLGELYAARGNAIKAHAEARQALRIDSTHGKARTLFDRMAIIIRNK